MDYLARSAWATRQVRVDKLSGGQQQKVQLGITIMDRRLLILDEPTKGLDPVNRRLLLDLVDERKADGATVVLVTHHMDEVERLCDRILLLKDGAAAAYGTIPEAQDRFGRRGRQGRADVWSPAPPVQARPARGPRPRPRAVETTARRTGPTSWRRWSPPACT